MSLYDYDELTIIGKAGKDAEMKFLASGTAITSFSVAVDRSYKKDGETVKKTIWYRVSVFGKFAEVCKGIAKGDRLLVVGNLTPDDNGGPRIWQKTDGSSGSSFEVNASTVRFLSDRKTGKPQAAGPDVGDGENFPF